jgi:hypothetical protein
MNFSRSEFWIYQELLIFEFLCLVSSLIVCGIAIYIVIRVPQFHRNLLCLIGNMGFSYGVIAGSRIIQILESAFDPNKGFVEIFSQYVSF